MKRYARYIYGLILALSLTFIVGGIVVAQVDEPPRLRVVHAAPGLGNMDVYVNETLFFRDIFFGYISGYVPVDPGDRTVRVRPADTSPGFPSLIEVNAPYNLNQDYTLIIAGSLERLEYWRLEDDNEFPGETTSQVRIVHASADTPTVEVCLADVCHILAFKQNTGYFLVDPGSYLPKVRINDTGLNTINTPPLLVKNDEVHTIFMMGEEEGEPGLKLVYTLDSSDPDDVLPPPAPGAPGVPPEVPPPPPLYPPVTGAFLSAKLLRALGVAGSVLILITGLGFWVVRRRGSFLR